VEATEILIKIRKIVRSINLESKKIQKEYGISIPQMLCLDFLKRSQNFQSTQKQLRDFLNLNSSTVTGIINRLEKRGLIARLPKRDDKRTTHIILTSKGSKLLENTPPLLHDRLSKKLENLSNEKRKDIDNTLEILIKYFEIESIDASPVITVDETLSPGNSHESNE
jgi:DNA-binding MarR family transcriptional regulator